jgi:hypothetical protein
LLDDLQAILLSFLIKLGPFAVALMPALFTAYAIFDTFKSEAGPGLALCFAVVVGLAFETVGIVATHTAIELYNGTEQGVVSWVKTAIMIAMVPVYVIGVAAVVWFSESAFTPLVQALGIASPFLTCIVYIAVALARDLSNIKQTQSKAGVQKVSSEQEEKRFERELKRERLQIEREVKLRELELKAQVQIEQAKPVAYAGIVERTEPVKSQHGCGCGRDFETVQALNAHSRFCSKKTEVATNGRVK